MKGIFLGLLCAFALTSATPSSKVGFNNRGCPNDITIQWFLPHEKFCERYYVCVVGIPTLIHCPAQTAFNTEKNVCDWRDNVDCGHRRFPDDEDKSESKENSGEEEVTQRPLFGYDDPKKAQEICAEQDSESILISHEDCRKYYQCNWGRPIVRECPTNLYYNPKNGQCDWQVNVDCTNVGVDNPNWSEAERECSKGSSLVPHKYCDWFYQCGPQGPIELPCHPGTVFDAVIQNCNWPFLVDCGDKILRPEEKEEVIESGEGKEEEGINKSEEDKKESKEEEEVTKPEVTEPEVIVPEVIEPEVTEPEVPEPEVPEPEVPEPEVPEPEVTEPEVTEPEEEVDDVIIGLPNVEN